MAITVLGFVTLPLAPNNYAVVAQGGSLYAVQITAGTETGQFISIQPDGSVATRPSNWQLGPYELAVFVPAGLRYTPVDGSSYLIAAVEV